MGYSLNLLVSYKKNKKNTPNFPSFLLLIYQQMNCALEKEKEKEKGGGYIRELWVQKSERKFKCWDELIDHGLWSPILSLPNHSQRGVP